MSHWKIVRVAPLVLAISLMIVGGSLTGKNQFYDFQPIDIDKLTRYSEDRVAYQRIEKKINIGFDSSVETLLVIKDKKIHLIKDGYDNPADVTTNRIILEQERRLLPDNIWPNLINNKPDSILITDRRVVTLEKYDEEFVDQAFGNFYREVRNKFIKHHTDTFFALMTNMSESGMHVERKPLPKRIWDKSETKYFTSVSAKTIDDKLYYAEDSDGDGITETFMVSIQDGFSWGYRSGPNILFIYNLSKEGESSKEVLEIIKDLAKFGYSGTPESMKKIKEKFPDKDVIKRMIDDIYRNNNINTDTYKPEQY